MSQAIRIDGHSAHLQGDISVDTVRALWAELKPLLVQVAITHVDFSKVQSCDTSAVALLLHMKRLKAKANVTFEHLPEKLNKLIKLSNCEPLFTTQ